MEFITWYLLGYDAVQEDSFKMSEDDIHVESFKTVRTVEHQGISDNFFAKYRIGSNFEVKSVKRVSPNSITEILIDIPYAQQWINILICCTKTRTVPRPSMNSLTWWNFTYWCQTRRSVSLWTKVLKRLEDISSKPGSSSIGKPKARVAYSEARFPPLATTQVRPHSTN